MPRYYIAHSSIFDGSRKYDAKRIMDAIRKVGGKNVRLSLQFGWSNQPRVVCFDAANDKAAQTYAERASDYVFPKNRSSLIHLLSYRKDW